jgi:short-subunit dehydrogenase
LGEQALAERDLTMAQVIIDVNFRSAAVWSLAVADVLERQGRGSLVVLGSVAGDRGRRSNYIYGAAKAGLAVLVEGISHRFRGSGPRAVMVKPGPTDTAMTAGMTKGGPLWSTPEAVAAVVRKAADSGGPVVYAPARWRLIMAIIRMIPAPIFNKMNF